jgi:trigger factor
VTINKEISRQEHSGVKMTLTVAKDDVRARYDEVLNNYSKNIQLPGFRKGKAPREVLARKFGDALKAEVLQDLIEKTVSQVFEDGNLPPGERPLPFSTPRLEGEVTLDPEKELSFSLVYDVFPVVNVGVWKGLEIEAPVVELSDEDVNRELEAVRERNAVVFDRDEEAAAGKGDVATVDYYETGDNGEVLPASERQDYVFTIGTGGNAYDLDDDILGMKKGETREFEKTRVAEEGETADGGMIKTVKLRVTLKALKERRLPELDDELAQDVDEKYHTLEDLKNNIRNTLSRNLERRLRDIKVSRLLEKITAVSPVEVPESMIRVELEARWRNLARLLNITVEQLKKNMTGGGRSVEEVQDGWRPEAVKALHSRLIVETLIAELGLEAGDGELEQRMEGMAAEGNTPLEDIKKYYGQDYAREQLREEIKEQKFLDILLAENTVKPGKKENYLDLMSNNG